MLTWNDDDRLPTPDGVVEPPIPGPPVAAEPEAEADDLTDAAFGLVAEGERAVEREYALDEPPEDVLTLERWHLAQAYARQGDLWFAGQCGRLEDLTARLEQAERAIARIRQESGDAEAVLARAVVTRMRG